MYDEILNATLGNVSIVSENHDLSTIDWRAGLADQAEMLKRSGSQAGMVRAAIERASLSVENGRVELVTARQPGWHKLGVVVSGAMTWQEAARISNLSGWEVAKVPASYQWNGNTIPTQDTFVLVRTDNGRKLATVGSGFKPIQNQESFEYLDAVLGEHGGRYEVAGALYGGEQIFMLAEFPKYNFTLNKTDETKAYVAFVNHHGYGSVKTFPTNHRFVCANTARVAVREDGKSGLTFAHTGNIREKVRKAQEALGLAVKGFGEYQGNAEYLSQKRIQPREYTHAVLDEILDITQAEALKGFDPTEAVLLKTDVEIAHKRFLQKVKRRESIYEDIMARYESSVNGVGGMRGTGWGAYNAVTDHVNHHAIGRKVGTEQERASRRFESVMMGDGDRVVQTALTTALNW